MKLPDVVFFGLNLNYIQVFKKKYNWKSPPQHQKLSCVLRGDQEQNSAVIAQRL